MSILLAFDSFKDSLSSLEAARAFERGYRRVDTERSFVSVPLSDGGEGFIPAMLHGKAHRLRKLRVTGPLGRPINSSYAMTQGGAVIEAAQANGIEHVPFNARNPMRTTSYGVGELILDALNRDAERVDIGVGGSATVDGGCGMAQALGLRFRDNSGRLIRKRMSGAALAHIHQLDLDALDSRLSTLPVRVSCDVTNPLCGTRGAARVFAPQKGASEEMVLQLEDGLENLAVVIQRDLGIRLRTRARGGAAGGLSAMLHALCGAELSSGIDTVLDATGFDARLKTTRLVVTGEGCIDKQSAEGKCMSGVIQRAHAASIPVIAIGGQVRERELKNLYRLGLHTTVCMTPRPLALDEALRGASGFMADAGARVAAMRML